jgi:hypothetical protein
MARRQKKSEELKAEVLEQATHKAIRDEGWLLPELEHEVAESEAGAAEESIELPQSLADPLAVLDRDLSQRQRPPREHAPDQEYQEELRRAARAGSGTISREVEERMRRDRRAAEKERAEDG